MHTHNMAFKNISLSLEAYEELKKLKKEGESFSEEVIRITKTRRISDVAGILSKKEAAELEKGVEKVRAEAKITKWH